MAIQTFPEQGSLREANLEHLLGMVHEVRQAAEGLPLSPEKHRDIEAHLSAVETELRQREPNSTEVKERLVPMRFLLDEVDQLDTVATNTRTSASTVERWIAGVSRLMGF